MDYLSEFELEINENNKTKNDLIDCIFICVVLWYGLLLLKILSIYLM